MLMVGYDMMGVFGAEREWEEVRELIKRSCTLDKAPNMRANDQFSGDIY